MKQRYLHEVESYFSPNKIVVIALSGGVDSMVLFSLTKALPDKIKPRIVLAHINHKLRKSSDNEEKYIRDMAKREHVQLFVKEWNNHPDTGIEQAGRRFRYDFFKEVVAEVGADYLLTGHHKNDQAETVLMRLVRGGRYNRMRGIEKTRPFHQATLYRPLLIFEKKELYDFAKENDVVYFEDETNSESDYTRNRYRNDILPMLKEENPQVESHLAAFAESIQNVDDIVNEAVTEALETDATNGVISRKKLLNRSESLQSFILAAFIDNAIEDTVETGPQLIKEARQWLVDSSPNGSFQLSGDYNLERSYDDVTVIKSEQKPNKYTPFEKILTINDWTTLSEFETIGLFEESHLPKLKSDDKIIKVKVDSITLPITVRHRRPGDRMTYKGSIDSSKKLSRIFIDQKVPKEKREKAYVVSDDNDIIIWIVNYKESALSIDNETDTMKYVFVYRKQRES